MEKQKSFKLYKIKYDKIKQVLERTLRNSLEFKNKELYNQLTMYEMICQNKMNAKKKKKIYPGFLFLTSKYIKTRFRK